ncbi:MAG: hypothetical protein KJ747_03990 [Actinobacteria bacterium]|nr:hypothetical protein [Actinomycetota bacterium]MCG2807631.1 hypothetical protein [Coriobacteriia bacterium]
MTDWISLAGYALFACCVMALANWRPSVIDGREILVVSVGRATFRLRRWWTVFLFTLAAMAFIMAASPRPINVVNAVVVSIVTASFITFALRSRTHHHARLKQLAAGLAEAVESGDQRAERKVRRNLTREFVLPPAETVPVLLFLLGLLMMAYPTTRFLAIATLITSAVIASMLLYRYLRRRHKGSGHA